MNLEQMPEQAWTPSRIASLKRGDTGAFALLVRQYQDMVLACGRTVGLRDDEMEDAAGETFLAAFRYIKTYRGQSKLSTWLWKIAYHKAVDVRRRRLAAGPLADDVVGAAEASDRLPGVRLEEDERSLAIWQAVQRLPESQAAAIVLFYREGRSIQEIAEILETPENTVKTWLSRGRSELAAKLQHIQENDHVRRQA